MKNHLSFGLRFPNLKKSSQVVVSLDMNQNENGISSRFQAKTQAIRFSIELGPWVAPSNDTRSTTASASTRERPRGKKRWLGDVFMLMAPSWQLVTLSQVYLVSGHRNFLVIFSGNDNSSKSLSTCRDWYMWRSPTLFLCTWWSIRL